MILFDFDKDTIKADGYEKIAQKANEIDKKMVQKVLTEDLFDTNAVSYLLNAIYFKGSWTYKFEKEQTQKEAFEHVGYTKEMTYIDMMHQRTNLEYSETEDCCQVRLDLSGFM